jgi:hypothetical protein
MRKLNHQLNQLCRRNRDGSESTRANRERILALIADQLHEMHFRNLDYHNLAPKHVHALLDRWSAENLTPGTIKNRLAALRWWAEKIAKQNVVPRDNRALGVPDRHYVTNESKAKDVLPAQLARIADPYVVMALRLQAAFGLRREESMKFTPAWADRGDKIVLKASWCKGGREREIPVRTAQQRALLDDAKALAGKGSLIPAELRYKDQLERYKHACGKAGISEAHGHRHFYAQERYRELTGWACPAQGGPTSKELTREQKAVDREARMTISHELGHGREQITAGYLGR